MAKKPERTSCSRPPCGKMSCCKIEALISVDERGQMVLPKEIRDKADIHTGDQFSFCQLEEGRESVLFYFN